MKKIIIILTLLTSHFADSQNKADYVYFNSSLDINMLFGIKDNPDTANFKDKGIDYDLELGGRDRHFGLYVFYGSFKEINYQNYGFGCDYYNELLSDLEVSIYNPFNGDRLRVVKGIDNSLGIGYAAIVKYDNFVYNSLYIRGVSTVWLSNNLGLTLRLQISQATDLPKKDYRKEFSMGFTFKFDR